MASSGRKTYMMGLGNRMARHMWACGHSVSRRVAVTVFANNIGEEAAID